MKILFALIASAIAVLSSFALAEDQKPQPQPANSQDEILCKTVAPETGTRMGARKVCHTRRQWNALRQDDREMTEAVQRQDSRNPAP